MPARISVLIKIPYTIFVLVFIPVYWYYRGPQNFLWGCDIALFLALISIWKEWRLPASMALLVTLIPDTIWILDLISRLAGLDLLGVNATAYMLDEKLPPAIRILSLFHLFLAPLLLWTVYRLGYDKHALIWQIAVTALILPFSYYFTDPVRNINWAHGVGSAAPPWPPGMIHVLIVMSIMIILVYLPTHFLLKRYFSPDRFDRQL